MTPPTRWDSRFGHWNKVAIVTDIGSYLKMVKSNTARFGA